uniref:Uncharacterized protein n=1 Tax=Anopheles epiroticus TaxID=199890 RepID=A0A182PQ00_9DIPT
MLDTKEQKEKKMGSGQSSEPDQRRKMLRFLSRRKGRSAAADTVDSQIKSQRIPTNKNLIPCRVILLDNTDLSVDLTD